MKPFQSKATNRLIFLNFLVFASFLGGCEAQNQSKARVAERLGFPQPLNDCMAEEVTRSFDNESLECWLGTIAPTEDQREEIVRSGLMTGGKFRVAACDHLTEEEFSNLEDRWNTSIEEAAGACIRLEE